MAKVAPKDLFDEKTMTFGEHLEELRVCLWKALIGVALGLVVGLFVGKDVMAIVRHPIDSALQSHGIQIVEPSSVAPDSARVVGGTINVTADASDEGGVTKVEFFIDGVSQATVDAPPYQYAWDTTSSKDGAHKIVTKAFDAANNAAASEPVTVTVDNTAPRIALVMPPTEKTVSGKLRLAGTASDDSRVERVALLVDDRVVAEQKLKPIEPSNWKFWSGKPASPFELVWMTDPKDHGTAHTLQVQATDAAGNTARVQGRVTIDNTNWRDVEPPKITITSPKGAPSEHGAASSGAAPSAQSVQKVDIAPVLEALRQQYPDSVGKLEPAPEHWWISVGVEQKAPAGGGDAGNTTTSALLQRGVVYEPAVQGAFMAYLKVSLVTGIVLSSPWVFYQIWMFVAAGLYHHERHYVYIYLPFSISLFLGGVLFCFIYALPMILNFLLAFNRWMDIAPMIRLTDWLSFAIMLPVMFGVAFQLPLVMLFLERIGLFTLEDYKSKRRPAILVIAVASMMLTPPDPGSMIAMMLPMLALYEGGIFLVKFMRRRSPFEEEQWQT